MILVHAKYISMSLGENWMLAYLAWWVHRGEFRAKA